MTKPLASSPALSKKSIAWDVGLCLVLLLLLFGAREIGLLSPSGPIADQLMKLYANVEPHPERAQDFAFIAIDADSLLFMDEPLITPRDRLVDLLDFVTTPDGGPGPRAVVVDIALSHRTDELDGRKANINVWKKAWLPADRAIWNFLERYDKDIPIILARGFSLDRTEADSRLQRPERSFLDDNRGIAPLSFWTSDVDANVKQAEPHRVFWASPLFTRDSDLLVRRWHLWTPWCLYGDAGILPSVQLISLALASDDSIIVIETLKDRFRELAPASCSDDGERDIAEGTSIVTLPGTAADQTGVVIDLGGGTESKRIVYTVPWHPALADGSRAPVRGRSIHMPPPIPAHEILDNKDPNDLPDKRSFDDRIVVIGASNQLSGDNHLTPIGAMPGAMVIINAIQSLSQLGTLKPLPWPYELAVAAGFMAVTLFLSYLLYKPLARLVTPIVVIALAAWLRI